MFGRANSVLSVASALSQRQRSTCFYIQHSLYVSTSSVSINWSATWLYFGHRTSISIASCSGGQVLTWLSISPCTCYFNLLIHGVVRFDPCKTPYALMLLLENGCPKPSQVVAFPKHGNHVPSCESAIRVRIRVRTTPFPPAGTSMDEFKKVSTTAWCVALLSEQEAKPPM